MPLSEREQRLLAQMEQALSAEDPKLVSTLTGQGHRPRPLLALALVALGLAILLTGLVAQLPLVGVIGFIVALTGTYLGITAIRSGFTFSGSITSKLEERWQQRDR